MFDVFLCLTCFYVWRVFMFGVFLCLTCFYVWRVFMFGVFLCLTFLCLACFYVWRVFMFDVICDCDLESPEIRPWIISNYLRMKTAYQPTS